MWGNGEQEPRTREIARRRSVSGNDNQGNRQVVEDYQRLFVNRRAYTMQSMRPHPETGRHYYFRPSKKGTDTPLMLTDETIRQHLEGKITVGLYAINPSTQRCKWVAIDADYKNSMEDLLKLQYHLTQDRVEPALEMSKRGGHLWIFLATPLLAKECRIYIHDLALRLGVPVKGAGLADGIEVFPKHDAIGTGEFGNAIRGPLGIHRGANRRFWFYGADYTLDDQIAYLNRLRKVTEEELRRFIAGKERPEPDSSPRLEKEHFNGTKTWTGDRTFAFWRTLVLCGRLAGITSRDVHPARTLATTASATTWPS